MKQADRITSILSTDEIEVLKYLCDVRLRSEESLTTEVSEITSSSKVNDKDEVLRALYSLEGRSLVEPYPPGDFTSSQWKITANGIKAINILEE